MEGSFSSRRSEKPRMESEPSIGRHWENLPLEGEVSARRLTERSMACASGTDKGECNIEDRIQTNAKKLRQNMTPQEKKLWYQFLKNQKEHWYKQRKIGNYIADFYCGKAKLVVELDGSQHYEEEAMRYDEERTNYLQSQGIMVKRYLNRDVDQQFEAVCMEIDNLVKIRTQANN